MSKIQSAAQSATAQKDWKAKAKLAIVAMYLGELSIAEEMLRAEPVESAPQELQNPLDKLRKDLAAFERLTPQKQDNPDARLSHARACFYLDRPQEALKDLEVVLAEKSVPIMALQLQALCLAREGSTEKAAEVAQKLAKSAKTPSYAAYGKILAEAWLGNLAEANRQFDELIANDTENTSAKYDAACIAAQLVRVYGETNRTESNRLTKRALELLRQAYKLGYRGQSDMDNDPDLAPLYGDAEFKKLLFEVSPPTQPWDPVQRTEFIAEFPEWCGEFGRLAERIESSKNTALRSGVSLAVGSVDRADEASKDVWRKVFENWSTMLQAGCCDNGASNRQRLNRRHYRAAIRLGGLLQ